jgi:hypothetical protein
MAKTVKAKKSGFALEMKTFTGQKTKSTYVVFRTAKGGFHTFVEVEAKSAAVDCDPKLSRDPNTRALWKGLWAKP